MAVYEQIRNAIINKQQVIAAYNGMRREMCPHSIGTKRGRRQGLFYQFAGESSSGIGPDGSPDNWRCIPIDGLSDVEVRDGEWHTAPNHTRRSTCVDVIDVEVDY